MFSGTGNVPTRTRRPPGGGPAAVDRRGGVPVTVTRMLAGPQAGPGFRTGTKTPTARGRHWRGPGGPACGHWHSESRSEPARGPWPELRLFIEVPGPGPAAQCASCPGRRLRLGVAQGRASAQAGSSRPALSWLLDWPAPKRTTVLLRQAAPRLHQAGQVRFVGRRHWPGHGDEQTDSDSR
jgi:hypothetical protein